jgi:alpha-N-acetylglucosaminidase
MKLIAAWEMFEKTSPRLKASDGFQYDLVDITRQVLANYATHLQQKFAQAYKQKDMAAFAKYSRNFIALLDDMDQLLSTRKDCMLGKWIAEARANGITPEEKDLYEFNARDLVTLWGDKESGLHEYSNRQWAGLIKGFYKPRWAMFFNGLDKSLAEGKDFDFAEFYKQVKNWEWQWVNSTSEKYEDAPVGNAVDVAEGLFQKYAAQIKMPDADCGFAHCFVCPAKAAWASAKNCHTIKIA